MAGKEVNQDLIELQWKPFFVSSQKLMIKYIFLPSAYYVLLSDLTCIYYEEMKEQAVLENSKKINPKVEIPTSTILKELQNMIEKGTDLHALQNEVTIQNKSSRCISVRSESLLAGVSFIWIFNLALQEPSIMFLQVIQPLLTFASTLKRQSKDLINIIKKKDDEIKDYKEGGAKSSFKYLETEMFKEEEFSESSLGKNDRRNPFEALFYSNSVLSFLFNFTNDVSQAEEVPAKRLKIPKVENEVKEEPVSSHIQNTQIKEDALVHKSEDVKVKKKPKKKQFIV